MAKKPSASQIESATKGLATVRREWLKRPNVTAVDVGYRWVGTKMTDDIAVRVHVRRKIPPSALPAHEVFNQQDEAPQKCGGFPIDVIEAEYGPANSAVSDATAVGIVSIENAQAVDRRSRISPLFGGISVGNPRITAGTLGAIVWDRTDCDVCILSNWHVLCGSSACTEGESIWQPGRVDGGSSRDEVAKLKRFRLDRHNDAALANLTGARPHSRDILGLNPISGVEAPALGMRVSKSGRTTEVTKGEIDGVSMSLSINYGGGVVQSFNDQIRIVPRPPWPAQDIEISMGGDSGSVWINDATGKAVGLHFAGETDTSPTAEHAIANQMVHVAKDMKLSFLPLVCTPTPPRPPRQRDPRILWILRQLCRRYPWICGGPLFSFQTAGTAMPGAGSSCCPNCGRGPDAGRQGAPAAGDGQELAEMIQELLEEYDS